MNLLSGGFPDPPSQRTSSDTVFDKDVANAHTVTDALVIKHLTAGKRLRLMTGEADRCLINERQITVRAYLNVARPVMSLCAPTSTGVRGTGSLIDLDGSRFAGPLCLSALALTFRMTQGSDG